MTKRKRTIKGLIGLYKEFLTDSFGDIVEEVDNLKEDFTGMSELNTFGKLLYFPVLCWLTLWSVWAILFISFGCTLVIVLSPVIVPTCYILAKIVDAFRKHGHKK